MKTSSQVVIHPQECSGSYKFNGSLVMTSGFLNVFSDLAAVIAVITLLRIVAERVQTYGADYLQIAEYSGKIFWIIDDIDHVTFLLPEEY